MMAPAWAMPVVTIGACRTFEYKVFCPRCPKNNHSKRESCHNTHDRLNHEVNQDVEAQLPSITGDPAPKRCTNIGLARNLRFAWYAVACMCLRWGLHDSQIWLTSMLRFGSARKQHDIRIPFQYHLNVHYVVPLKIHACI
jgi:hypothetical protein